ncbi:ABC transporter ATP-binding protein [Halomarina salina]|uniref:ABC transporter ATP-binding protein n=1 Tax=Halomarina salina TaxID=1872699 RepID=A0ABD5RND4_9EURY|nr:oligopeptide/dipeptide ABC transporter ATP-binding protein [Halomarina salina]
MNDTPLLRVTGLEKHYPITRGLLKREVGRVRAVDGVDFEVAAGETLGLVGESGCGKSTVATSLLRLEEPTAGEVRFDGEDVTTYDKQRLKRFRRRAQMIFQDPTSSFDPRMSIGESVAEPLLVHGITDRSRRREIVMDLLERVGLSAEDVDRYPHEFSGGQKQRVALARALVVNPQLLVADEPVSALDVSIQSDILNLMNDIQEEFDLAMLFISHDLGVVREVCDRVAVMYLGEIVEVAPTEALFSNPQHPYTTSLLGSIPRPDPTQRGESVTLVGDVPSPSNPPAGCRFHTRCPEVIPPADYAFEQGAWRSVQDLRQRMREGPLDLETVRTAHGESVGDAEGESVAGDEQLKQGLRAEFDIPRQLSDPEGDAVLERALTAEVEGDHEEARDLLDEAFRTPCEQTYPELRETEAGWEAACLLHEDQRQRVERPADD